MYYCAREPNPHHPWPSSATPPLHIAPNLSRSSPVLPPPSVPSPHFFIDSATSAPTHALFDPFSIVFQTCV